MAYFEVLSELQSGKNAFLYLMTFLLAIIFYYLNKIANLTGLHSFEVRISLIGALVSALIVIILFEVFEGVVDIDLNDAFNK